MPVTASLSLSLVGFTQHRSGGLHDKAVQFLRAVLHGGPKGAPHPRGGPGPLRGGGETRELPAEFQMQRGQLQRIPAGPAWQGKGWPMVPRLGEGHVLQLEE